MAEEVVMKHEYKGFRIRFYPESSTFRVADEYGDVLKDFTNGKKCIAWIDAEVKRRKGPAKIGFILEKVRTFRRSQSESGLQIINVRVGVKARWGTWVTHLDDQGNAVKREKTSDAIYELTDSNLKIAMMIVDADKKVEDLERHKQELTESMVKLEIPDEEE